MIDYIAHTPHARPVLKWAGGKSRLLPELMQRMPRAFDAYHEPFIGSGALFFKLMAHGYRGRAHLSDINPALMEVYIALRDQTDALIAALRDHEHAHDQDYYYHVRALSPHSLTLVERAARFIYLNKTCYNGLYRENRSGQFNVPFGRYKNPTICDEPNLRAAARVLRGAQIEARHFSELLTTVRPGDFVYFDPPYHPISTTSNFTAYHRYGFNERDQVALREVFAALTRRGVRAMLSNSSAPLIHQLYAGFRIEQVYAARAINSKAGARGKIAEVVVCNYDACGRLIAL